MRCARCKEENPPHAKFCEQCTRSLVLARERGVHNVIQWSSASLGVADTLDGRTTEAVARLEEAGDLAARREPPASEEAMAHYRQALVRVDELGMRPLIAHCHLGLGKLYRRTGERQEAKEHLTTATSMYREMDMRFWLEQAEAELGALG
jgi:tetratricopeptide (TPR) repeat protein